MTKIDHERRNLEDKAKKPEPERAVAGSSESKTLRGVRKQVWRAGHGYAPAPASGFSVCPKCDTHVKARKLRKHIVDVHCRFKCPLCQTMYEGANQFRRHVRQEHGKAALRKVNRYLRLKFKSGL